MTVLYDLAKFSANISFKNATNTSIENAKRCILDTYGVTIMAKKERKIINLCNGFKEVRPNGGNSYVWGMNMKLDPAAAAFLNTFLADYHDYDDVCYAGMTHPSSVFLPAIMGLADHFDATGEDIICAMIAGWEVSGRIGESLPKLLYDGWQCSSLFGSIGAAAAAARVLHLSADQTLHSMSLLMCQIGGIRQSNGSKGKPFTLSKASENAVTAALSAKAGITGSYDMMEGKAGYFNVFAKNTQDMSKFEKIGNPLIIDEYGVCIKSHPICSSGHAAVEAVEQIFQKNNIDYKDIKAIHCDTTNTVLQYLIYHDPKNLLEAEFSLPFIIASTAYFKSFNFRNNLTESALFNSEIRKLMQKITWQGHTNFKNGKILETETPEAALITITLNSGEKYSATITDPVGFPKNPLSLEQLCDKIENCTLDILSRKEINILADKIMSLDKVTSIKNSPILV